MKTTLYHRSIDLGNSQYIQSQCIRYTVPLEELHRAAQGVPMEELEKLTEPEIFVPDHDK